MINKEMKLKVIDLVIEDYSTRRVYNDGNARIVACYVKVLHNLKKLVSEHDDTVESVLYFDYVINYWGDMSSVGRIYTGFFKEFETVKSYIDKVYGFINDLVDYYITNNFRELIFTEVSLDREPERTITIDLTQPLVLE